MSSDGVHPPVTGKGSLFKAAETQSSWVSLDRKCTERRHKSVFFRVCHRDQTFC